MGDTVLAGPVEFSPAEIAALVAILIGMFLVVTAPGWAALGYACVRRRRNRGAGPVWPAALGGSLGGLAVSFGVCSVLVGLLPGPGVVIAVLLSWCACWGLSAVLTRDLPRRATTTTTTTATTATTATTTTTAGTPEAASPPEGWGR
jgi:hypothetical protein